METGCEKLKKVLNTVPEAPINIDSIMDDIDVKGMMKRYDIVSFLSLETIFKCFDRLVVVGGWLLVVGC